MIKEMKYFIQIILHFSLCSICLMRRFPKSISFDRQKPIVIVGSGPAGLATSIMLAKRGYVNIKVYDKLPRPPSPGDETFWGNFEEDRSYNMGLSSRGQIALSKLGCLERIKKYAVDVLGSQGWSPEVPIDPPIVITKGRTFPSRILQRDRLTGLLMNSKYNLLLA